MASRCSPAAGAAGSGASAVGFPPSRHQELRQTSRQQLATMARNHGRRSLPRAGCDGSSRRAAPPPGRRPRPGRCCAACRRPIGPPPGTGAGAAPRSRRSRPRTRSVVLPSAAAKAITYSYGAWAPMVTFSEPEMATQAAHGKDRPRGQLQHLYRNSIRGGGVVTPGGRDVLYPRGTARHHCRQRAQIVIPRGNTHATTRRTRNFWRVRAPWRRIMRFAPKWAGLAAVSLGVSALAVGTSATALASGSSGRADLAGSLSPAIQHSTPEGAVPAASQVNFDLVLALPERGGGAGAGDGGLDPGSAEFHQYLTDAQWEAQYSPSASAVAAAQSWLSSEGFRSAPSRPTTSSSPPRAASARWRAPSAPPSATTRSTGSRCSSPRSTLSIPSSLSGVVAAVEGVNQSIATTAQEPAPPAGFRNPQPCSSSFGQKTDTADKSSLYAPYTSPLAYDICGYTPSQLRSAYGLSGGATGAGVAVAVVDSYDSPTLFSDAHHYFALNDPSIPLSSSQFINDAPGDGRRPDRMRRERLVLQSRPWTSRRFTAWRRRRTSSSSALRTASTTAC